LISATSVIIELSYKSVRDALAKAYDSSGVETLSDRLHAEKLKEALYDTTTR
jgi:hypothetical protein